MQLLSKREKNMTKEEKIQLEIMRTIASAKGFNLREQADFNFTIGSSAQIIAKCLTERFNIEFKEKKEEKIFWPEREIKIIDNGANIDPQEVEEKEQETQEENDENPDKQLQDDIEKQDNQNGKKRK